MNETVVEVLKALGYPLGSVLALVVLAYISRQFFQKLLETVVARDIEDVKRQNAEKLEAIKKDYSLVLEDRKGELSRETERLRASLSEKLEAIKNDYSIVLEDRKGELGRETERLRASLSVEVETYRLAAAKRFDSLMGLWESSESLFKDTDFSDHASITKSLELVNIAVANLNKYSILFSETLEKCINDYLNRVATVLTNKESDFQAGKVTAKNIAQIVDTASDIFSSVVPFVGIVGTITSDIILSTTRRLEARRLREAEKAREVLASALRIEFGVMFSEEKPLVTALAKAQNTI